MDTWLNIQLHSVLNLYLQPYLPTKLVNLSIQKQNYILKIINQRVVKGKNNIQQTRIQ